MMDDIEDKDMIPLFEWYYGYGPHIPHDYESDSPPSTPPSTSLIFRFFKVLQYEGLLMAKEVVSSSAASAFSVFVTHPFDVIKLELVTLPPPKEKNRFFSNGLQMYYEIRKMYKAHGFSRFYRGHVTAQHESLFQTISMFYTQQRVYQGLEDMGLQDYPACCSFISGFLSATFAVLALKPIEVHRNEQARRRMLLQRYGPIQAAYDLKQPQDYKHLFKGCFPEFMFLGTQYGLRFYTYDQVRNFIIDHRTNGDIKRKGGLTNMESLFAGAISAIVSDVLSHPLDVVNSRLQMTSMKRQHFIFEDTCRHYFQCIRLLWKKNSLRGLYAGLTPNLAKSMVAVSLQFSVYNQFGNWLDILS